MSRSLQRVGAFVLAAAAAAVAAPMGCADNEQSLFIHGMMDLQGIATCSVTADPTSVELLGGILDPAFGNGYKGLLLVGNQLLERGNGAEDRLETSRVEIYAADVQVLDSANELISYYPPGKNQPLTTASYTIPVAGFADASADTTTPGYGLVDVLMIDPLTANAIVANLKSMGVSSEQVVSSVKLHGRTLGGEELTTAAWTFPITVCANNCLCDQSACIANTTTTLVNTGCDIGQDSPVPCEFNVPGCIDCRIVTKANPVACTAP